MITPDPGTGTLSVHRLVQAVSRTPDPDDPHRAPESISRARRQAAGLLHAFIPTESDWDDQDHWRNAAYHWRLARPHAEALIELSDPAHDTTAIADLLHRAAALWFRDSGPIDDHARTYLRRAAQAYERTLGPDHPKTLTCSRGPVDLYYPPIREIKSEMDKLAQSLGEDVASHSRKTLGDKYRDGGDLERAVLTYEAVLACWERVFGKHPETLTCRNDLADAYVAAGDLSRAIALYESTLADYEQEAGPDTTRYLATRHGLAMAWRLAGNLDQAIAMYEATLADAMRKLGPDYFRTQNCQSGLAYAYRTRETLNRPTGH